MDGIVVERNITWRARLLIRRAILVHDRRHHPNVANPYVPLEEAGRLSSLEQQVRFRADGSDRDIVGELQLD